MESEGNYFHTFYFQAFSDQFALVSEEFGKLAEEGEGLLSEGKVEADGDLSAQFQDVRRGFMRIQQLVEKQGEYERFEKAVQDYKNKLEAVNGRLASRYDGVTSSFKVTFRVLILYLFFISCIYPR